MSYQEDAQDTLENEFIYPGWPGNISVFPGLAGERDIWAETPESGKQNKMNVGNFY